MKDLGGNRRIWILNIKSLLVIWFKILDLCFHTLVSSNRFIILCRLLQNSQTEHRKGHRTVFLSFFTPQQKRLSGYCFHLWCPGWVGGLVAGKSFSGMYLLSHKVYWLASEFRHPSEVRHLP